MAKSDAKNHFYKLSKWAIKTVFDQDDCDGQISLHDLQSSLERAWHDMIEDGLLELKQKESDGKENNNIQGSK